MGVKKLKPSTPGQRWKVANTFVELTAVGPEKSLTLGKIRSGGRNAAGKMTLRYRGGGHKKKYRMIDFKRDKDGVPAVVKHIAYDPNRTAFIALLAYADGEKRYIVAPNGLRVGDSVVSGPEAPPEVGNALFLSNIPLGTILSNIELRPGRGAVMARSAGSWAQLLARDGKYATVKLPSGESRMVWVRCKATIGVVSNADHQQEVSGKAGRNRWKGRRPRTRGVAMNPVDHPMGGGEGRASGGHPRSRRGLPAKGYKTRSKRSPSHAYRIERREK